MTATNLHKMWSGDSQVPNATHLLSQAFMDIPTKTQAKSIENSRFCQLEQLEFSVKSANLKMIRFEELAKD